MTTSERGVGDVIITYENDCSRESPGVDRTNSIYPDDTVVVENPIAVIDRHADRQYVR